MSNMLLAIKSVLTLKNLFNLLVFNKIWMSILVRFRLYFT